MKFYTLPAIRYWARYGIIFILFGGPAIMFIPYLFGGQALRPEDVPIFSALCLILFSAGGFIMNIGFLEKCFASLTVTSQTIEWKCPFRRTCKIPTLECRYFGVQLEDSHNGLDYAFIYISKDPYPKEYEHRINKLKCSDGFIKFWYSDELCDYLVEKFPHNRTGPLQYYRRQMNK